MTHTGYLGIKAKLANTVINPWTNLPTWEGAGIPNKENLMRWMNWPANKPQCLMEWKKTRYVTLSEWFEHLEMIKGEQALAIWKRLYGSQIDLRGQGGDKAAGNAEVHSQEHGNEAADYNDAYLWRRIQRRRIEDKHASILPTRRVKAMKMTQLLPSKYGNDRCKTKSDLEEWQRRRIMHCINLSKCILDKDRRVFDSE